MKRILFVLLTLICTSAFADDVRLQMSAPGAVAVGEQFRLTLSINERGSNLQLPNLENFDVLMGPSTSSSTSIQYVNGKRTRSSSYSHTYVLSAKETGTFKLEPAKIKVGSKTYASNSISIQVIKGQSGQSGSSQAQQSGTQTSSSSQITAENLFVEVIPNKRTVYKGEQIHATIKIFSRVDLTNISDASFPSFEGFWTQDIEVPPIQLQREAYKDVIYNVGTIKEVILVPQQTGDLSISPFELTCAVRQRVNSQSVFNDFFGSSRSVPVKVQSKPVSIKVKPLPSAPAAFDGAVGTFKVNSSIDKTSIKANEAITIRVKVSGNGNLKHINSLNFDFPADFEVYDPKTSYNFSTSAKGITGSTSFEYLVIPRFAGDFTIPAADFTYFDTQTKKYKTVRTKSFDIHVEKGDADQTTTIVNSLSKEDVKYIGQDIRYIKQAAEPLNQRTSLIFFGSLWFVLIHIFGVLAVILLVILLRHKIKQNANIDLMRNKKASKMARKHLKVASKCVKDHDKDAFYGALLKAFWGYLSDKLTINMSSMNRVTALEALNTHHVDEQTIKEFESLIDACEMAKFAPSTVSDDIESTLKQSERLINIFEKQIRKQK